MDLVKSIEKASREMWNVYKVEISFSDRVLGQVAESLEARLAKVEALVRAGKMPEEVAEKIREETRLRFSDMNGDEEPEDGAEEASKQMTNIFWRDTDGALYIEKRVVKSAIRDCLSQLGIFKKKRGSKGAHNLGLYVEPDRLKFLRGDDAITEPDGVHEMPVHVMTAQGPRSAITRSEYIEEPSLRFEIRVLKDAKLGKADLISGLALLQKCGIGGKRSQGFGQLTVTKCEMD